MLSVDPFDAAQQADCHMHLIQGNQQGVCIATLCNTRSEMKFEFQEERRLQNGMLCGRKCGKTCGMLTHKMLGVKIQNAKHPRKKQCSCEVIPTTYES